MNSGLKLIWSELLNIVHSPNITHHFNDIHNQRQGRSSGDGNDSCEMYLMRMLTNPLSLKQLSRIAIRNRIIENMKCHQFVRKHVLSHPKYQLNRVHEIVHTAPLSQASDASPISNRTCSILQCLIWQLELPRILHSYLYEFPDVPPMPEDIAVFVND